MATPTLDMTTSFLYRWRYWFGYGAIGLLLAVVLYVAGVIVPGALTDAELRSIVASSTISEAGLTSMPINAPYYALLHLSLSVFGVTLLGVKLPSLILGFLTAVIMLLLLRRWFSPGVAVLASVVAITTGQFLFVAQQGATSVLYLFWPTLLLLLATLVAKRVRWSSTWKILFFISAALSLYTPLSLYVLIALGSAIVLHPHLRYLVRRLSRLRLAGGMLVAAILLVPLVLTSVQHPSFLLELLGIPTAWPDLWANLQNLAGQYLGFMSLGTGSILLPIFGMSSMLMILFGLYRLVRSYTDVQSYVILAWLICLLPVLILSPGYVSIMFVPLLLLLASGLEGILRSWYRLFPKNPYARVAGLIPLTVLVGSMVIFGLERYSFAYRYAPDTVHNFTLDPILLPSDTTTLVTSRDEQRVYQAIARYQADLVVTTTVPATGAYTVTAAAYDPKREALPTGVIVNHRSEHAARFYTYKN